MSRFTSLLLGALVAGGLLAAPAPFRKPGPWFDGWDKPIDPVGDCQFDREGDRLTITLPGKGHQLDLTGRRNAPRLLKDVEGDFVVQVRVRGNYRPADLVKPGMLRQAGLFLANSKSPLKYAQSAKAGQEDYRLCGEFISSGFPGGLFDLKAGPPLDNPVTLRLTRRGDKVWMTATGEDGKKWSANQGAAYDLDFEKKLKVGVFAASTAPGIFKVVFDKFGLTPLAK
jgi:regulation of enolase protein 1 (concanavalin A-like superfamily)